RARERDAGQRRIGRGARRDRDRHARGGAARVARGVEGGGLPGVRAVLGRVDRPAGRVGGRGVGGDERAVAAELDPRHSHVVRGRGLDGDGRGAGEGRAAGRARDGDAGQGRVRRGGRLDRDGHARGGGGRGGRGGE